MLALDAYGDAPRPALSTAFTSVDLSRPPARATSFHAASGLRRTVGDVLDIADAANQFAPVLPPDAVAGLPRAPSSQQAVGLYGGGLAQVLAVPLQEREACSLAEQLTTSGARTVDGQLVLRVGPLGVALTFSRQPVDVAWVVAGTVTDETLVQAARDLDSGARFRG